jgi:hypothetical protein
MRVDNGTLVSESDSPDKKASKKLSKRVAFDIPDNKKVYDIFQGMQNNEVKVFATFVTVK